MSETHSRTIIPALGLYVSNSDGWSRLGDDINPSKGWFNWKEAAFYLEFDGRSNNNSSAKYEKILFKKFSFVENLDDGFPPNISIDEDQIVSREEISEEDYRKLSK